MTGELIHASFEVINTDNERFPTEETALIAAGRPGRVIEVRYECGPGGCAPENLLVRAVMSSLAVD